MWEPWDLYLYYQVNVICLLNVKFVQPVTYLRVFDDTHNQSYGNVRRAEAVMSAFVCCSYKSTYYIVWYRERDIIALSMEVWLSVWPEVTLGRWQPPIISLNVLTGRGCTPRRPPTPPLPAIHQMLPQLNYQASKLPESKLMMHEVCNCVRPYSIQDGLRYEYSTTEVLKLWRVPIGCTRKYNAAVSFVYDGSAFLGNANKIFGDFSPVLLPFFQRRTLWI
jgi:hypothetical protein